jgi:GT2 family glycosyltransferase/predicted SAM-dependent methyltransferase
MISIIIPVWNQEPMTHECIAAIMDNTKDYEIIVIDNGSDPPFKSPFTGFNDLTVIRNDSNLGFPKAANQGIKAAKGDVVVIYNNDVICTPGWADRLVGWLDEFDIIAPMTNFAAGIQNITINSYSSRDELDSASEEFSEGNDGLCYDVNFATIGMFVKKIVFDNIGYLDEGLWPSSGEDIDIGFRAREAGYRVGVARDVYVHHEGSQTFAELEKAGVIKFSDVMDRNDKRLAKRWGNDFWNNQMYYGKTRLFGEDAVRLNLGCGEYPMKGFINVDQFENVHPDLLADATDLPYGPDSVDEIYCGNMLEHLSWDEGQDALKHWWSILRSGAEISIVVPDFDVLGKAYFDNPSAYELKKLNDLFMYSYVQESLHRYFYSADLLKQAIETAGFVRVAKTPVNHSSFVDVVDWQCGFVGVKP